LFQKSTTISKFNFLLIDETISATWGGGRIAPQFWAEKNRKTETKPKNPSTLEGFGREIEKLRN